MRRDPDQDEAEQRAHDDEEGERHADRTGADR